MKKLKAFLAYFRDFPSPENPLDRPTPKMSDEDFVEMLEKHLTDVLIRAMKFNHKEILNRLNHYQDYHKIK